jgi:hypothetical protein
MRILLLLVAIVVRPPLDDLHAAHLDVRRGALGRYEAAERDDGGDGERDGREEAEDVLQPHQRGVHVGLVWGCSSTAVWECVWLFVVWTAAPAR